MNFLKFNSQDHEYILTYLTKSMIITNGVMFLISIFYDIYNIQIEVNQLFHYFIISFFTLIICIISILLHYFFINENKGQYIFYLYSATSIAIIYPKFLASSSSFIVKIFLIILVLIFMISTCFSLFNVKQIVVYFTNYMLILIAICLVISLGVRHEFSIRSNYSFLACTIILGKIFQYLIKKGFPLMKLSPLRVKFAITVFFACTVISLQTFFSWLPINPFVWNLQYLPYKFITINFLFHLYMALISNSIKEYGVI